MKNKNYKFIVYPFWFSLIYLFLLLILQVFFGRYVFPYGTSHSKLLMITLMLIINGILYSIILWRLLKVMKCSKNDILIVSFYMLFFFIMELILIKLIPLSINEGLNYPTLIKSLKSINMILPIILTIILPHFVARKVFYQKTQLPSNKNLQYLKF